MNKYKPLHLAIGIIISILTFLAFKVLGADEVLSINGSEYSYTQIGKVGAIALLMAYWWITEAVSIYATSLVPVVLFPAIGVMDMKSVAPFYMQDVIFLFIGGFLMAYAVERWNLHRRIALKIVLQLGATPSKILFGFMFAGYFLSMWILNTATAALLLPAVLAVIGEIQSHNESSQHDISTPFLLGLAYSCSIGGMATLIGTLPNLSTMEYFNDHFTTQINFANWFAIGFPTSLVMLIAAYFLIKWRYKKPFKGQTVSMEYCRSSYANLGKMKLEEKIIGIIFIITILLWFTRKDIEFGNWTFQGWGNLFENPNTIKESTIAMAAAILMLLIPSKNGKGALINWKEADRLPIGIVFLFGGGFALANAMKISGFSVWMGTGLTAFSDFPPFLVVLLLSFFMIFFTELTSNTASVLMVLPILLELSKVMDTEPALLFIPITMAASCAFMLPIATPPNTIVYASEKLSSRAMLRTGFWLNLIGVGVISSVCYFMVKIAM